MPLNDNTGFLFARQQQVLDREPCCEMEITFKVKIAKAAIPEIVVKAQRAFARNVTECYVIDHTRPNGESRRISKKEAQPEDVRDAIGELLHDFIDKLPGAVVTEVSAGTPVDLPLTPRRARKTKATGKGRKKGT